MKRKAEVLLNLLLEDYARVEGLSNATFKDMIVNEEVECFAGYDDELGHLNEEVNLHDCISEDYDSNMRSLVRLCKKNYSFRGDSGSNT